MYISETDENFNVDVIYFLHSTLGEATPDEYKKLAEKNFGISNLKIPESWIGDNGKVVIGRGGNVRYYTVLDEGNVGGGGSVTVYVQFYGDSMKTIKSHTVEYIFKDMGTYVQFVSCNVAVREEYEPGGYSV